MMCGLLTNFKLSNSTFCNCVVKKKKIFNLVRYYGLYQYILCDNSKCIFGYVTEMCPVIPNSKIGKIRVITR